MKRPIITARSGHPSVHMAVALDPRRLWRETPSTLVVRNGPRFAGISSKSVAADSARAPSRLRPVVRSSSDLQTPQLVTEERRGLGSHCSAPQSGQPI